MIRQIWIYGLSTAIQKGAALVYLPIIIKIVSLEEFGIYSLIQTGVQFLIPILSFGGSAAILREGTENSTIAFNYLIKFSIITFTLGFLLTGICWTFDTTPFSWLTFTLAIATVEALLLLLSTCIRSLNNSYNYLLFSIIKALGILGVILIVNYANFSITEILFGQIIWYICLALVYFILLFNYKLQIITKVPSVSLWKVFPYTIPLIPHSVSQWIMSSSDRFIIEVYLGSKEVGIYSVAYTVSLIMMLINSGIALSLPQYVVTNYKQWISSKFKRTFLQVYSILIFLMALTIQIYIKYELYLFNFLPEEKSLIHEVSLLICYGLYFLGIYYLYSSIIFYHKKTIIIAKQTLVAALINIIMTINLVPKIGVTGAAIATAISYLIYLVLVIISSVKLEKILITQIFGDAIYISIK